VGCAVGFLLPPVLVPNSDSLDQVGHDLSIMFYGGAAVTTTLLILVVVGTYAIHTITLIEPY
jgi:hypothetical protein